MLSAATFYDCIHTIYQFIKPFLDNKMSIFEEYGAFKPYFGTAMVHYSMVYDTFKNGLQICCMQTIL